MENKNTEIETVNGEGNAPAKGKELSIIDQYILEETNLSETQVATLKRFQGTEYDSTFIILMKWRKK